MNQSVLQGCFQPRRSRWLAPLVAALLVIAAQGWRLGSAPLSGTEGHRAITAHQMAEGGSWVTPHLFGAPYLRKPPFLYWVQATFELALGASSEWVWRLPSLLSAAALAAFMAVMARRWFGPAAGWGTAAAFVSLVATWSQTRSADIDALHTCVVGVTAMCLIEIGFGRRRTHVGWIIAASLGFAATVMTKGHAGLPLIIGVYVGASAMNRRWRWLRQPGAWAPILVAVVLTLCWGAAVLHELGGMAQLDTRGLSELQDRTFRFSRILASIGAMVLVLLYSLPATFVAAMAWPALKRDRRARALAGAAMGGMIVFLLNGVTNPRYGYILLPLAAPLAGAAVAAWHRGWLSSAQIRSMRMALTIAAGVMAVTAVVLAATQWSSPVASQVALAIASGFAVTAGCVAVVMWLRRRVLVGSVLTVMAYVAAATPLGEINDAENWTRSAYAVAPTLAAAVGDDVVVVSDMIWDKPELLHYAEVNVIEPVGGLRDETFQPSPGQWMLLSRREWKRWKDQALMFEAPIELPTHGRGVLLMRWRGALVTDTVDARDVGQGDPVVNPSPPDTSGDMSTGD